MREILFRGKDIRGEWEYGVPVFSGLNNELAFMTQMYSNAHQVIPETVGQYTGLTDKNGNKIFEGDILKSDDLYEEPLLVTFNEKCSAFQVLFKDGYSEGFLEQYTNVYHLEVIGNIHDNPELLEVNK